MPVNSPSKELWNSHKDTILQLTQSGMPVKDVAAEMERQYGFKATLNQYSTTLKQWGYRKNLTTEEWVYVERYCRARKAAGKLRTGVYFNGTRLPEQRVTKALTRYVTPSLQPRSPPAVPMPELRHIVIRTPSPAPAIPPAPATPPTNARPPAIARLPSTGISTALQGHETAPYLRSDISALSTQADILLPESRCSSIGVYERTDIDAGNYLETYASPPFLGIQYTQSDTIDVAELLKSPQSQSRGHFVLKHDPRLIKDLPIFQIEAFLLSKVSKISLGNTERQTLTINAPDNSIVSKWLSTPHPMPKGFPSPFLRAFLVEGYEGQHVDSSLSATSGSPEERFMVHFCLLLYALSNDFDQDSDHQLSVTILRWVVEHRQYKLLGRLLSIKSPTITASISTLFYAALMLVEDQALVDTIAAADKGGARWSGKFKRQAFPYFDAFLETQGFLAQLTSRHSVLEKILNNNQFQKYLEQNDRQSTLDEALSTAVLIAAKQSVELLLQHGANVIVDSDPSYYYHPLSMLRYALYTLGEDFDSAMEITQSLLRHGASPNSPTGGERPLKCYGSSLQIAARRGMLKLCCVLVQAGALVNAPAVGFCREENFLEPHGFRNNIMEGPAALQLAICSWDSEERIIKLVELFRLYGADVNYAGAGGYDRRSYFDEGKPIPPNVTALQASVWSGNLEVVRYLLQEGAEVDEAPSVEDKGCATALQIASYLGRADIVDELLRRGPNVSDYSTCSNHSGLDTGNGEHKCSNPPLACAIQSGDPRTIELILQAIGPDRGPNSAFWDLEPNDCFRYALAGPFDRFDQTLDRLKQAGYFDHTAPKKLSAADIFRVSQLGSDQLRHIVQAGVDINTIDSSRGVTALHYACQARDLDAAKRLIAEGANVNIHEYYESAGLECMPVLGAVMKTRLERSDRFTGFQSEKDFKIDVWDLELVDLLLSLGASTSWTYTECCRSNGICGFIPTLETATWLFNRKPDVDFNTYFFRETRQAEPFSYRGKMTALHRAAVDGDIQLASFLIARGANVNFSDNQSDLGGPTPLQTAVACGHWELIKVLIDNGAEVNAPASGQWGGTALQTAIRGNKVDIAEYLLDHHGADVNAPPGKLQGLSALQAAAENGQSGLALKLINLGADVNMPGGNTALEAAAGYGRLDTVQLLLNAGAGPCPCKTWYATRSAKLRGHIAVAKMLEEYRRSHFKTDACICPE